MGLGDFFDYEARIRNAVDSALDKNIQRLPGLMDAGIQKAEEHALKLLDETQVRTRAQLDEGLQKVETRTNILLDGVQDRLKVATDTFFSDLERRWERRLEAETRAQFKLLNRVLLYTLVVALLSLAYAFARVRLGW